MIYCDIHTHSPKKVDGILSIYNLSQKEFSKMILADEDTNIYYSAGLHPWYLAENYYEDINSLETLLGNKQIVAVGEAGLDKLIEVPMELQIKAFEEQIRLSEKYSLPIIIHCVKAWDELLKLYKEYKPQQYWIVHGFRGNKEQAMQLQRIGLLLSVGEYYNKEALQAMGLELLLIETDESKLSISSVYDNINCDLACDLGELKNIIRQNVSKVFNI